MSDRLSSYDGTREGFAEVVRMLLDAAECPEGKRQEVREAAKSLYQAENWDAVRFMHLDRAFLQWVANEKYLLTPPSPLSKLPMHVKGPEDAAEKRINRAAAALRNGLGVEAAVGNVCSIEELNAAHARAREG